jgi:MFS family permease
MFRLKAEARGSGARPARNVVVLAVSIFGMALGEELWQAYLPAYLSALGATGLVVGLFGSLRDLLDSVYQYPGGWLADRLGPRRALPIFTTVAIAGYTAYAVARSWPVVFVGILGVMAWKAGAFPATFAVVGDSLPAGWRAVAFSVQSVLVRVPRVVAAPVGGLLIGSLGIVEGVHAALLATLILAAGVLALQRSAYRDDRQPVAHTERAPLPSALRRLLVADCLVRIGEGVASSFIVLFLLQARHVSPAEYGVLYAVQQSVSIAFYLPGGRIADRTGRGPLVALTFVFFAVFPLAVRFATSFPALVAAFCLGGLKEIGEPARKSLIVDLAPAHQRARTVAAYYGIRNLVVVPAGMAGGLLWQFAPTLPLDIACLVGIAGAATFAGGSSIALARTTTLDSTACNR